MELGSMEEYQPLLRPPRILWTFQNQNCYLTPSPEESRAIVPPGFNNFQKLRGSKIFDFRTSADIVKQFLEMFSKNIYFLKNGQFINFATVMISTISVLATDPVDIFGIFLEDWVSKLSSRLSLYHWVSVVEKCLHQTLETIWPN